MLPKSKDLSSSSELATLSRAIIYYFGSLNPEKTLGHSECERIIGGWIGLKWDENRVVAKK
jgi:hypothetical protein